MISPKVRWPSQRSSTWRPVPCSLIAPSGKRMTRFSSVPPQRQPVANRGLAKPSRTAMLCALDLKRPRRPPSRLHVGEVERVELCPENVAFVAQSLDRQFLLAARLRMIVDVVRRELRIFGRLIKSGF